MSVEKNSAQTAPFRDRIIPWYFVGAFLVIFAVNGLFVYLATSTHPGVVTENSFEYGIDYDAITNHADQQHSLNWNTTITLDGNHLQFSVLDPNGQSIDDATVIAHITRPTDDEADITQPLNAEGSGLYSASIAFTKKGQWDITIATQWNQQQHQTHKRVIVK